MDWNSETNTRHSFCLMLADTLCVPSMRRILFVCSFLRLDKLGDPYSFGSGLFRLMLESHIVDNGILHDGLCKLNVN